MLEMRANVWMEGPFWVLQVTDGDPGNVLDDRLQVPTRTPSSRAVHGRRVRVFGHGRPSAVHDS
jgi:hypothetical protein